MKTIIHADDFGINADQSLLILSCSSGCGGQGPLNSTSMLVGSPHAAECAELIRPFVQVGAIRIGLHLNLVEGPSCADPATIPLLVDAKGMFRQSFAGLLLHLDKPGSSELAAQVALEVRAQLDRYLKLFPDEAATLRVDSHQHFHLIPAVFDALCRAVAERGCTLQFMRIPAEPVGPYLSQRDHLKDYPPVNGVKNALLNYLWKRDAHLVRQHFSMSPDDFVRRHSATFYGLMLSGRMECSANEPMVEAFEAEAARRGTATEILFHPGGAASAQDCLNPDLADFVAFYLSEHRTLERNSLRAMDFRPYQPL